MKQISFLRHAKSDWANESLNDIDRPLNLRGYAEAYALSEWFLKNNQLPDFIFTSSAIRTVSTTLIFARTLDYPISQIAIEPQLYETDVKHVKAFIHKIKSNLNHVMMVGHNPVSTDICNYLLINGMIKEIPTCGLVSLQFDCNDWKQIKNNSGKLSFYQFPKDLK